MGGCYRIGAAPGPQVVLSGASLSGIQSHITRGRSGQHAPLRSDMSRLRCFGQSAVSLASQSVSLASGPYRSTRRATLTRRAYQGDLDHFLRWGGVVPASPLCVARYLAAHAETHAR
jgi:hypothetical protein